MTKKLKLSDLYVTGEEVTVSDGPGREVTVWCQKLNPLESEDAFRRAQAARSRVLSARADPAGDAYQSAWMDVLAMGDGTEELIQYLVAPEQARFAMVREAELAADEEWAKDNYLQGLRDLWADGLKDTYAADPEDPDAARVFAELRRFSTAVEDLVAADVDAERRSFEGLDVEELRLKVLDAVLDFRGNTAWLEEFHSAELYLGVRESNNHRVRYFENRAEVDELAGPVFHALRGAFDAMRVDVIEGKDLPETATSSPSSEPSDEEATVPSPGLVAASP